MDFFFRAMAVLIEYPLSGAGRRQFFFFALFWIKGSP